ncbi:MAG TPA: zinc metalloprotease HtpX [Candidatus Pacebacteria bacterium]|nr:zinc metalloprotease HtpX [Candidatus Paceibacterota bacterium]
MTHYQLVSQNQIRSWLVVSGFMGFVGLAAWVMTVGFGFGPDMIGWALVGGGLGSILSYYFSDQIILGISGAREAKRSEFFDFYTVTENLAASARLPQPKLYVIDDTAMNAFATGRDAQHAVVCATTGLVTRLNRAELEGVIAHELSHIRNSDMLLMSLVSVLVGMLALLSDWLLRWSAWGGGRRRDRDNEGGQLQLIFFVAGLALALLSPLVAQLIQLAISRNREFLADASSAALTKNPQGLIRALEKISVDPEPLEAANKATAHLYIANPLKNRSDAVGWFAGLFATHPPVSERIKALKALV